MANRGGRGVRQLMARFEEQRRVSRTPSPVRPRLPSPIKEVTGPNDGDDASPEPSTATSSESFRPVSGELPSAAAEEKTPTCVPHQTRVISRQNTFGVVPQPHRPSKVPALFAVRRPGWSRADSYSQLVLVEQEARRQVEKEASDLQSERQALKEELELERKGRVKMEARFLALAGSVEAWRQDVAQLVELAQATALAPPLKTLWEELTNAAMDVGDVLGARPSTVISTSLSSCSMEQTEPAISPNASPRSSVSEDANPDDSMSSSHSPSSLPQPLPLPSSPSSPNALLFDRNSLGSAAAVPSIPSVTSYEKVEVEEEVEEEEVEEVEEEEEEEEEDVAESVPQPDKRRELTEKEARAREAAAEWGRNLEATLTERDMYNIRCLQMCVRSWLIHTKFHRIVYQYMRSPESSESKRRMEVLREILKTETDYVSDLERVVEVCLKPLREIAEMRHNILTLAEIRSIFSIIEMIFNVNSTLLNDLKKGFNSSTHTVMIGEKFLRLAPFLRLYTEYINNYNTGLAVLTQCRKRKEFAAFLKLRERTVVMNNLDLTSFLIKPVQRLPRYVLLLTELLKYTPEDHVDYESLTQALNSIQGVADYVNEHKREAEGLLKVVEIQAAMGDSVQLVNPTRRLIRQGDVKEVYSRNKLKDRHLFLFNDLCVVAEKNVRGGYNHKRTHRLDRCLLIDVPDREGLVNLLKLQGTNMDTKGTRFEFLFSAPDKKTWKGDVKKTMIELMETEKNRNTLVRTAEGAV